MPREVGQPDGTGLADDQAEDAVAPRRRTDPGPKLRVDPVRDEALQEPAVGREHADGGVSGTDDLGGDLHHSIEDRLRRGFRDERRRGDDETLQPFLRGERMMRGSHSVKVRFAPRERNPGGLRLSFMLPSWVER